MQSEEQGKETSEKNKESWLHTCDTFNYVMSDKRDLCPEVTYMSAGEVLGLSTHNPHSGFHDFHNALSTSDTYSQGKPCWLFIL